MVETTQNEGDSLLVDLCANQPDLLCPKRADLRCLGEFCAWYDDERKQCEVKSIRQALEKIPFKE